MSSKAIDKYLNSRRCPDDVQAWVLLLLDGTPSPAEKEKIMNHLSKCDSCRSLIESFSEIILDQTVHHDGSAGSGFKWDTLDLGITSSGIRSVNTSLELPLPVSSVLSGGPAASVKILSAGAHPFSITVISKNGKTDLHISNASDDDRYYLILGGNTITASPVNGVAVFEEVPCGTSLMSRNFIDFIQIVVEN